MSEIKFCLGWDTQCDIDASIITLDSNAENFDKVYWNQLKSKDGSIVHSGDNLTGEGDGDDEIITVHLDKISKKVDTIWPVINIYTDNMTFDDVEGAFCRIIDAKTNQEFCRYNLSENHDKLSNGNIVANLKRHSNGWSMKVRGYYT